MSYEVLNQIAQNTNLHGQIMISLKRLTTDTYEYEQLRRVLENHFGLDARRTQSGIAATLRSSRAQFPPYLTIKLDEASADPNAMFVRRVGTALIQVYEGGEHGLEGTGQGAAHGRQQEDQVVLS